MLNIKSYFDGSVGTPVNGRIEIPLLVNSSSAISRRSELCTYYSDSFFSHSATSFDHDLAIMSLCMTMPAFTVDNEGDGPVRSLFRAIGCDERMLISSKFDDNKNTDDTCAYIFGMKRIPDTDTFLLPVVIRSHRYGGEWVSNAHVVGEGCPDFSAGFKQASDGVYDALMRYIDAHSLDRSRLKIWVSGFSRGAAVANLLGGRLTLESGIGKDNIFVYTFAAPRCVYDRIAGFMQNIFNIVSELDIVPRIPLKVWGFVRYGIDLYLPCAARRGVDENSELLKKMQAQFSYIMDEIGASGTVNEPFTEQEIAIDLLMDYLDDILATPEKYEEGGYQSFIMEFLRCRTGGEKLGLKEFVLFLTDGNEEAAASIEGLFANWNGMPSFDKVRRISALPKYIINKGTPAGAILSTGFGILLRYAKKLTAQKVTGGDQDFYYDQLVSIFVDTYNNGRCSALMKQHWPETYLAWLRSGREDTLFRTDSYQLKNVK